MEQEVVWVVKALILPPGGIILLALLGLVIGRKNPVGAFLTTLSLAALYLFSTPYIANQLMAEIETFPALAPKEIANGTAQAIVVLGGGRRLDAAEFQGDTVSGLLLERLRYAAYLSRLSGLPVIPSGGSGGEYGRRLPEAYLAKRVLEEEFNVPVAATEENSRTTWDNAFMTAALLRRLDIGRVFLVTHAMHMPRSIETFRGAGVDAIAAPTAFYHHNDPLNLPSDWLPNPKSMQLSYYALHELLGGVWYAMRQRWKILVG
jgi:uncharacterized SAM-binding protein YcdF (DUF218 family)